MAYDANLVLRGKYGTTPAYVDLVTGDAAPTTVLSVTDAGVASGINSSGNSVVDLGPIGTGVLGLDCVVILHDTPTTYKDTCDIVIQDSEHLTDGWQNLLSFPRLYCYMREVIVTATTAFIGTDIGLVFTATTSGDTGIIREFSRNLLVVGGTGKCWVEMQDAGDTYATNGVAVACTTGTGRGTIVAVGRVIQTPLIMVRRFSTPKRYIRCSNTVSTTGNYGDVDILVTGSQHSHVNNLYH